MRFVGLRVVLEDDDGNEVFLKVPEGGEFCPDGIAPKDHKTHKAPKAPKAPKASKASKSSEHGSSSWDLESPDGQEAYYAAVLKGVKEGALTSDAIRQAVGGTSIQAIAALAHLVAANKLEITSKGPPARHRPIQERKKPRQKAKSKAKAKLRLEWKSATRKGRKGYAAAWDHGHFLVLKMSGAAFALFYEKGDTLEEYGCGTSRATKSVAREIAAAGVPTGEQWRQKGLGSCPTSTTRVTKSESAKLTWTETIEGGKQVCVAPTVDGEFVLKSTPGGSFALIFYRTADESIVDLGFGSKDTLQRRAHEVVEAGSGSDSTDNEQQQSSEIAADAPTDNEQVAEEAPTDDEQQSSDEVLFASLAKAIESL